MFGAAAITSVYSLRPVFRGSVSSTLWIRSNDQLVTKHGSGWERASWQRRDLRWSVMHRTIHVLLLPSPGTKQLPDRTRPTHRLLHQAKFAICNFGKKSAAKESPSRELSNLDHVYNESCTDRLHLLR